MHRFYFYALLFAGLAGGSLCAQTAGNCAARAELEHQQKDADTIERLERAWSHAYITGDADFEQCLLAPDYSEIKSSGKVGNLSDELAGAAKNKGKNLPVPEFHKPTILIHEDVAVAHGTYRFTDSAGKDREMHYADFYHWEAGGWRVFFAQQTLSPPPAGS